MIEQKKNDLNEVASLLTGEGIDTECIQESVARMIEEFGENPQREGLLRTPERVARMYIELPEGYRIDPVAMVNDARCG